MAERLIDTHTSKVIAGTLPSGDIFWQSGTYRQRYSPTDEAMYYEILVSGTWYIQTTTLDSSLSASGLTESPVQEIN